MSEDINPELIEKAANAVRHERAYIAAAAFGVPLEDVGECAGMIARAVLSAVADDLRSERVREAMDSHRCDEQAERAYRSAITAEADARKLHSARDEVAAEATLAREAHRSCRVDHFAHDYCRWVGMSEAYQHVLNILDRREQ